jgi:hypothetical protein
MRLKYFSRSDMQPLQATLRVMQGPLKAPGWSHHPDEKVAGSATKFLYWPSGCLWPSVEVSMWLCVCRST